MKACTVEGCDGKHLARGFCNAHYQRLKKTGSPTGSKRPSFEDRFWSKVEKTDDCWNWTASLNIVTGYGQFNAGRRGEGMVPAHRVAYELTHGPIPDGLQVDILCHNRACVNPDHQRLVTNKQNAENVCGVTKRNTSGALGVHWDAARGKWIASVGHNGEQVFVGRFLDVQDAEAAVIAKRLQLFTHNERDKAGQVTDKHCWHGCNHTTHYKEFSE